MSRLYVSNDSYPELREIGSRWERHRAWWRAFASASRDARFWRFAAVEGLIIVAWIACLAGFSSLRSLFDGAWIGSAVLTTAALLQFGFLLVTWGGDIIRPHLRRTSPICRDSCPGCGHQLTGHLLGDATDIRCPECAAEVPRSTFEPPFAIPRRFLAVGKWLGAGT